MKKLEYNDPVALQRRCGDLTDMELIMESLALIMEQQAGPRGYRAERFARLHDELMDRTEAHPKETL